MPNPLGIYDLHGNVGEWTSSESGVNSIRVVRGGAWSSGGEDCAASKRSFLFQNTGVPYIGFRLLAVPSR